MNNFNFYNPVNIVFGKDTISELASLIPLDKKILMTYGGGSIKKNGVYDQVKEALKNHNVLEFSGIEPNPKFETCMNAVQIVKNENIDFLLAVGGGSVLDGTKFISAASKIEDSKIWETIICGPGPINFPELEETVPLGSVITLPATGSEMNNGGVISNLKSEEKFAFISPKLFPVFSIIDPQVTYTLPKRQVINGLVDSYVHTLEQYITYDVDTPLQDRQAEAILATLIQESQKILADIPDYESRANLFWCATQALNGNLSCGVVVDWATHMIGHELTAFFGVDHAQSLAIVIPQLWRNQKANKVDKLAQYGSRVFNINESDKNHAADLAISKTEEFFKAIGMKLKLSDYGIDPSDAAEKISKRFAERKTILGEHQNITPDVVKDILLSC